MSRLITGSRAGFPPPRKMPDPFEEVIRLREVMANQSALLLEAEQQVAEQRELLEDVWKITWGKCAGVAYDWPQEELVVIQRLAKAVGAWRENG